MKKYYRAVFISDLHMGMPNSNVDILEKFLHEIKTDHIYIVGDFIDFWHMRVGKGWSQECNIFIKRIFKMIEKGTKITILPGNHDSLLYLLDGFNFGNLYIKEKEIHTTKDGNKFVVIHGDIFDSLMSQSHYLSILSNSVYDFLMKFNLLKNIVEKVKYRVDKISKNLSNYEQKAIEYAVAEDCFGIICGHSHFPRLEKINGIMYGNCGDLITNNTLIVENENGLLELISLGT